ncbi:hypothetical protein U27_02171 [Candidatus Vecturithrix granuli]|uniref:Uncharacterized protein n=1 Tax=Vecturithrix granuli TaxID=1499967 RepID=A0A0S6WA11_VECG1|nr:hypothetical protein U27_02171 [Candidatus Vecturithrix granuli]
MKNYKFKYEMYKALQLAIPEIYKEAAEAADEIGIPKEERGKFGLTGAISGCHGIPHKEVREALEKTSTQIIPNSVLDEELRYVVKSYYGDEYDALAVNTCEAALWVSFDTLATPPMCGRGDNYRARYIIPYEKHLHHHGGYGRPFPGRYKDIFADRGNTAGELGFYGKRQNNLDMIIAKLVGADYSCHGIKYHPAVQLTGVDAEASAKRIRKIAKQHATLLTAIASLGYDTPGYGYKEKAADGAPLLQKLLGDVAADFNVPYIVDNAWGVPFIGTDIRKTGADVILYSMDKAAGSVTAGLIIGKEEALVQLRRALGTHGDRWGTGTSHGKAAYVTIDPGKEGLVGVIAALKVLLEHPERVTKPIDELYQIVVEEFGKIDPKIRKDFSFAKSYNSGAVEINYEASWQEGGNCIPIFSIEDMYSGTNIFQTGTSKMGIIPTIAYDGNIFISPGLGTTDLDGNLIEEKMRWAVKGMVKLIEIVCRKIGII